jgi:hypothetical protein
MTVQYNPSYHAWGYNESPYPDTVAYNLAPITSNTVTAADWLNVVYYVNTERNRRASGPYLQDYEYMTDSTVSVADYQGMIDSLWYAGYGYNMAGVGGVSADMNISVGKINEIIAAVNNAGSICLCNCNYCTCNCNYCTCNCNYACTCNCNYSDRRLKKNIKMIGIIDGVKAYTFSYLWDDTVYVGAMAQDLIGTDYESALSKDARGFYVVDYTKLPFIMQEVKEDAQGN